MEPKRNIVHKNAPKSNSVGETVFRVLLNLSLLVLLKMYFLVPDIINKGRKYALKKKTAARNMKANLGEESMGQLPELKYSSNKGTV